MSEVIDEYEVVEVKQIVEECNNFNTAMINKMINKLADGYSGWDEAHQQDFLENRLLEHVEKGFSEPSNLVDIANFCMMLYSMKVSK